MSTTTSKSGGVLPALTSIRFFAALTVVLSHFTELGLLNLPKWFFNFVDGGRPAVSLFFVLSGFILTYTYRKTIGTEGPARFYVARFARIYPVVLLSLVLSGLVTAYLLSGGDASLMLEWYALKNSIYISLAVSLICQLLLLNAWFPFAAINQPWNGPSWSISCEAFFYALFPLLLRRLEAIRVKTLFVVCAGLWILQGLWIVFLQHALPASRHGFLVAEFPITHLFEFIIGMCTAIKFDELRARGTSLHSRGVALISVALVAILVLAYWRPVSPAYYLESPFFAALILGLVLLERPVVGLLNQRWLVRLGEASYSLYLIHVPLAHLAFIAGFRQSNGWIAMVFSICLSAVIFQYFEEPMRRRIRARLSTLAPSARPATALHDRAA
ncbi:acetylase [Caballeronia udeis]|uniref:Acetylase n=1 Tax=Caballeronia udeis TaxID=1232866 RepID=A0A158JE64_9BURK|nr:acyltransferase [Caballeronia udeis]SAL67154.1 acetylase [Caballeronia udeis]